MKKQVTLLCLAAVLTTSAFVATAYAAGKHYWKCYEKGCDKAKWNGSFSSREQANEDAKKHERESKGHRWDLKEE